MEAFTALLVKIIPLYGVLILGVLAVRLLHAKSETVAVLLMYVISPGVVLYGMMQAPLTPQNLGLPFLFLILCSGISLVFAFLANRFFPSESLAKNLLSFTAGSGNTGYFGLPVALAIFGPQALAPVVLCTIGYIFYENSLGFFWLARARATVRESLGKLLKLPALYAFLLGIAFNVLHFTPPAPLIALFENFKGAYSLLGIMIVGMGLAGIQRASVDKRFLALSFCAKFLAWPALAFAVVFFDAAYLHLYDVLTHRVIILLSLVPLAANTVTFATVLNVEPEKAAFAVFLSMLVALVVIPLVMSFVM